MKTISLLLILLLTGCASQSDWKSLYDGESLKGWSGDPKFWRVEDGAITGETTKDNPTKGNTFIIFTGDDKTPDEFGDFEVMIDYRIFSGNSGVQYRSFIKPGEHDGWRVGGYQSDLDFPRQWAGTNYGESFRGILAKRGENATLTGKFKEVKTKRGVRQIPERTVEPMGDSAELAKSIKAAPEWNTMHIIAKGNVLIQKINGVVMSKLTDNDMKTRRMSGLLALQLHQGPPMKVQFKNIKIKEHK